MGSSSGGRHGPHRAVFARGVTSSSFRASGGAVLAAALAAGCTHQGLPVQHVVVYRNGVAYFERTGHVSQDEVRFVMKETQVGDFLATLAVMEKGGSSVRVAAFPIQQAEGEDKSDDQKKGLQTIALSLDGKGHDLQVGYVTQSPVWKPTYRVVVHANGKADLQVWGIVQNLSGEDWKDVRLSLATGAPLAFEADLEATVIPSRPLVTDPGQVTGSIPHGETTLSQQVSQSAVIPDSNHFHPMRAEISAVQQQGSGRQPSSRPQPTAGLARGGPTSSSPKSGYLLSDTPMGAVGAAESSDVPPAVKAAGTAAPAERMTLTPRDVRSLATVAVEGASTRYDVPAPVSIRDKSAAMVMVLSRGVPGETLFLFAPDDGVPLSAAHPFRVARFKNDTAGPLEPGPITMFEEGAFLGQGFIDAVPAQATATVPFALERGIAVGHDQSTDETGERLAKIENGEIVVERDAVTRTTYHIRNGGDEAAKCMVKHARAAKTRLFSPPVGTQDNVDTAIAFVPITVPAHQTSDLVVDERQGVRKRADFMGAIADSAVRAYLADPKSDQESVRKLGSAWNLRNEYVKKSAERTSYRQQAYTTSQETEEARRDLRATEKNGGDTLRQTLATHLSDSSTRLAGFNKKISDLDARLSELQVLFDVAIHEISISVPPAQ